MTKEKWLAKFTAKRKKAYQKFYYLRLLYLFVRATHLIVHMSKQRREPTFWEAIIPVLFLIIMLSVNVIYVFGDDAISGSNQIVLILSATVAALIALRTGIKWEELQDGIVKSISASMSAILILLLIGSLAGTWLLSGIVPAMIYYGLQILNPTIFLFAAVIICAVVNSHG
ncbi:Na+/H+ antiporter NhaC [Catalinimonas alkaloidigena]|nr:Na+/H+ antiporter NhaC [Catalinimonas alkaloidigena]